MSMLAHVGSGAINTWGFAYVGGIIGLVSVSLLYVSARVTPPVANPGRVSIARRVAAIGPLAIAIGGVCGVSIGLGIAGALDDRFSETVDVNEVIHDLSELRVRPPGPLGSRLHDDVDHVITDLDAVDAEAAHRSLHEAAASPETSQLEWNRAIDELMDSLDRAGEDRRRQTSSVGRDDSTAPTVSRRGLVRRRSSSVTKATVTPIAMR